MNHQPRLGTTRPPNPTTPRNDPHVGMVLVELDHKLYYNLIAELLGGNLDDSIKMIGGILDFVDGD